MDVPGGTCSYKCRYQNAASRFESRTARRLTSYAIGCRTSSLSGVTFYTAVESLEPAWFDAQKRSIARPHRTLRNLDGMRIVSGHLAPLAFGAVPGTPSNVTLLTLRASFGITLNVASDSRISRCFSLTRFRVVPQAAASTSAIATSSFRRASFKHAPSWGRRRELV